MVAINFRNSQRCSTYFTATDTVTVGSFRNWAGYLKNWVKFIIAEVMRFMHFMRFMRFMGRSPDFGFIMRFIMVSNNLKMTPPYMVTIFIINSYYSYSFIIGFVADYCRINKDFGRGMVIISGILNINFKMVYFRTNTSHNMHY